MERVFRGTCAWNDVVERFFPGPPVSLLAYCCWDVFGNRFFRGTFVERSWNGLVDLVGGPVRMMNRLRGPLLWNVWVACLCFPETFVERSEYGHGTWSVMERFLD